MELSSKNIPKKRTVSQAPSPPSPSPSPPSQTTTSSPPSVLDSGVYSRSSGPSSEAPSTCSTSGGSSTAPGGSPQSSNNSSSSGALGAPAPIVSPAPPPVVRSMSDDPTTLGGGFGDGGLTTAQRKILFQHQQSVPVTQAEVASNQQRAFNRSNSRSDVIKQKLKKNAAIFFGVDADTETKEKNIWLGRRKRLASRRYGELKAEYREALTPNIDQRQPTPQSLQPDVCPTLPGRDDGDGSPRWPPDSVQLRRRQKPSVASMTFKGVALLAAAMNKHRSRDSLARDLRSTRSYSPSLVGDGGAQTGGIPSDDDEVFFDRNSGTETVLPAAPPPADFVDSTSEPIMTTVPVRESRHGSWRRAAGDVRRESSGSQLGLSRISGIDLDRAHDNSDRKQFGQGIIHRLFGRSLKRSVMSREPVKEVLEDLEDHRPFFTYWLTTVQILILAISLVSYGFGPFGMDLHHQSSLVLVTSLSLQQVDFTEPANFWLGPRAADLIHLGAKFSPCMRRDAKIMKEIEKGREKERETACCIRNDDSGCVQSSKNDCSDTISTWKKWGHSGDVGPGGRISGSVCGLDPKYCEAPASVAPYEWPDDITKWPICRKTSSSSLQRKSTAAEHMACEVIGHPCCIGIHATCRITTKEYCDFVHGHFHDEASLCSQVSCLDDVCGMLPFVNSEVPDQFYRLLTSIFLHAGLIQLGISLWIQWFLMRDLEKLTGTSRIIIIYIGSGVAGNLASAIFVPYRADVGPAGSQSGLLACLIVEILNMWPMLKHPYYALFKHLLIALFLFIIGLLPWFDNFSSFFGFIFGFLLSYAILPFVSLGEYDRHKKIFLIWVCLVTTAFLFLLLVLFFYVIPVYDCEVCGYFNCLPLTRDFCSTQNINFKRSDAV